MNDLISYASDFVSFFISKTKNLKKINEVILFGSVARETARKKSDIDIFIDVISNKKEIEKETKKIKQSFFESVKYKKYWRIQNIKNEINIITDKIENWQLKDSIAGDAITLYAKYSPEIKKGKNMILLSWENIKPNSKRVLFNKKIFGFKARDKFYPGLIELYGGEKLSKGTIAFDAKYTIDVLDVFRKFKVNVKINKMLRME